MHHLPTLWIGTLAVILLTACSSGSDGNDVDDDPQPFTTPYLVLNLTTGTLSPSSSIDVDDASYRDDLMVFRAVDAGSVVLGQADGTFAREADEIQSQADVERYYMAAFECSQAQWQHIAGTTPWTEIPSSVVATVSGERSPPAYGLSLEMAEAALAGFTVSGGSLALPTETQWEYAAKAGQDDRLFAWGDEDASDSDIARHAVLASGTGGDAGPRSVGERQANAFGFYDLHGNVWELTAEGGIRGGSWADPIAQARTANRNSSLVKTTPHPLVGIRPVLVLE